MAKKIFFLTLFCCCSALSLPAQTAGQGGLRYEVIVLPDSSFGYDIYQNGKMIVHQNSIPAINGTRGFSSRTKASRAAKLVIQKIRKGEMPPAVTEAELKKIKAL